MSSQKYAASIRQYTCSRENGSREKTQRIEPIFSNQIQFDSKIYRYHILSFTCTFRTTVWISRSHSTALCILIYCSRVALRYDGLSFSRALHMCVLSTIHLPLVLLFESMLNERWFFSVSLESTTTRLLTFTVRNKFWHIFVQNIFHQSMT